MCLRVAGAWHREQAGSSLYHCCRCCGEGSRSYVALIRKLSRAPSICQMSCQLSFLFSNISQFVHLPCLAIETALACRSASSCLLTSSTTSRLREGSIACLFVRADREGSTVSAICARWLWWAGLGQIHAKMSGLNFSPNPGLSGGSIFHMNDPKELRVFGRQLTFVPGTSSPQKQTFELKTLTPREYIVKDLHHIFTIFQK